MRVRAIALITIVAAAVAAFAAAAAPRLNDTGVTSCIDDQSALVPCGNTGQDAEFGRDLSHPADRDGRLGFRFQPVCVSGEAAGEGDCPSQPQSGSAPDAWGCTHDRVTGLLWESKTADQGPHDGRRNFTHFSRDHDPDGQYGRPTDATGFVAAVNRAGLCGVADWRMPTPAELVTLVDMGGSTLPAIDARFLPNTAAGLYWAAGSVPWNAALSWGSDFAFGLGAISAQFRADMRPVRLVSASRPAAQRFRVSGDGQEVTDRATGLVWRRCLEGQRFDGRGCSGRPTLTDWFDALQISQQSPGWRLPNIKELVSLLDHSGGPFIDRQAFPGRQAPAQWASTPMLIYRLPTCASFQQGLSMICNSFSAFGLRLVREPQ